MKELLLEVEGQNIKVKAQKINDQTWIHYHGRTIVVAAKSRKRRRGSALSSDPEGEVLAPMPGKVIKVIKKIGDRVVAGDVLVVLEAMKMEYSLEASVAGVISGVGCVEGDLVSKDQSLVVIDGE